MDQLYLESRIKNLKQKIDAEKNPVKKLIYEDHLERLQSELDSTILFKIAREEGFINE